MSRSSPARRSQLLSSPDRTLSSGFLQDDRNSELSHRDALAAAHKEHERVRNAALRVYELHELQREHQLILEEERKEEARLRAEALIVAEEKRLRELRAKTVPRPPPEPEPPTPPPPPAAKPSAASTANEATPVKDAKQPVPSTTPPSEVKKPAPAQTMPTLGNLLANNTTTQPPPQNPFQQKPNGTAAPQTVAAPPAAAPPTQPAAPKQAVAAPQAAKPPIVDRYLQIHQELKKLRKELQAQSKIVGSPLKGKLGTFRREIRVSIGQLTGGKGANAQPINKITAILKDAVEGQVQSPPINVGLFVMDNREPMEGASHNEPMLPSLFIYLLNICAKGVVSQFINEAGANTKAADPVGVFAAHIFSHKDFQWRGKSLVDVLMAKYRVACPVLFGYRGNDRTERGRIALGWKKEGPAWITEQAHNDRMVGLGAGYASLSLRDFSKSSKTNPYPPVQYWKALAGIVNSPVGETSNTQYVVLRAMIEGHEQRFFNFYGNAAREALRLALVEFPKKAPQNATAAGSLRALADLLQSESGLILN